MGIKKYIADKDTTITNAYGIDLSYRATGSNMGAADILETFSIYGQQTTSSAELSRVLVQFPVSTVITDRAAGTIPESGSVSFYLRLFNARHSEQLPKDFTVNVLAVSSSWQEGQGLDMEGYTDKTKDVIEGSNWINANSNFVSSSATIKLAGGTNLASMHGQTFTLTDSDGTSQLFTIDYNSSTLTGGTIGFDAPGIDQNDNAMAAIKSAINNISALDIEASTITAVGDATSEHTLLLKQKTTGIAGNISIDLSGVTGLSVDGSSAAFTGGDGKWASSGGDYHTSAYVAGSTMPGYSFTFENGYEDLLLDVTSAVEEWIDTDGQPNYGFGIFLTSSQEAYTATASGSVPANTSGQQKSFYTKRFFARSSEYFFKKPALEARWDSRIMDDRGQFYSSSSMAPAADNLNNLFLYNYIRGTLKSIPEHHSDIKVKLYASSNGVPVGNPLNSAPYASLTYPLTGIYKTQVSINTTSSVIHDVWSGSAGGEYKTGSIKVKNFNTTSTRFANDNPQYVTKITNLKPFYNKDEKVRFRVFTRERNFSPTIYTVANSEAQGTTLPSSSFEVIRMVDERTVIQNSTGSTSYHTFMSYDNSGSYFDLDMSLLEPGYMYGIKLAFYSFGNWKEQEEVHKFRVENN